MMMRSVVDSLVELLPPPPVPSAFDCLLAEAEPEDPVALLALAVDDEFVTVPATDAADEELAEAAAPLLADCATDDILARL